MSSHDLVIALVAVIILMVIWVGHVRSAESSSFISGTWTGEPSFMAAAALTHAALFVGRDGAGHLVTGTAAATVANTAVAVFRPAAAGLARGVAAALGITRRIKARATLAAPGNLPAVLEVVADPATNSLLLVGPDNRNPLNSGNVVYLHMVRDGIMSETVLAP